MAVETNLKLGALGTVLRGVTFNGESDFRPLGAENSIELLRSNNVQGNSLFLRDTYNLSLEKVNKNQVLVEGDLLICMANGSKDLVGKSAYVDSFNSGKYTFGSFMGAFRPNEPENGLFIKYILQSDGFRNHINLILAGSSINNLTPSLIEDYEFVLPEIRVQKGIAKALSEIDELIESIYVEIAKTQNVKEAVCRPLVLGNTRLNGFTKKWVQRSLGDELGYEQPTKYLVNTTEHQETGNVPVLTAGKSFILGYSDDTEGVYTNTPTILFDDFTTDSKFVDFNFKVKSSACKMIKTINPKGNLRFFHTLMQYLEFRPYDHKRYWISEYSKLEILVPELIEQNAIAAIVEDFENQMKLLKSELAKYECIKQGMAHDLLTGKVRLV